MIKPSRRADKTRRTVERAVEPYRQELEAEARAAVRFETAGKRFAAVGKTRVRRKDSVKRALVFMAQHLA